MMPPNPSAASCFSSHTRTFRSWSAAIRSACSASQAGVFRLDGTVASIRASQPAPPSATARRTSSWSSPASRSARTTRPTGRCSGSEERQWKPNDPSIAPTTKASRPAVGSSAGMLVASVPRSRAARATAAPARRKSVGRWSPTPTSSTSRSFGLPGMPAGVASWTTSPVLPTARSTSSTPSRSVPRAASSASAPGPSSGVAPSPAPGRTGSATTSASATACGSSPLTEKSGGATWTGRVGPVTRPRF